MKAPRIKHLPAKTRGVDLSKSCSVVMTTTRMRFKWNKECDEPVSSWRNQYFRTRWIYASGKHFGVKGTARLQSLVGKSEKDLVHRRSMGECEMPTSSVVQGPADQVVVALISPIPKGRSKGHVDTVVSGVTTRRVYCLFSRLLRTMLFRSSHWKRTFGYPS